ncbi:uncharacterized protein MYCFIDRAFT_209418 [Pseudocercospora fijiensis CIRAD86]|uniref:Uncharacterized protein n=1 Tax=Pseudocercospora fijiensis (strain CIRAD86) TaxID=383855 RepID=M2ZCJ7_PSEFD|nr:uncharacterized protein MYCFIDRAFT_209418 [Pseudocercospora fijiensis CIRAD86]EME76829.1 hypothetical protein MYCFIDRAFT_209418 [Pseudocercospora fijiensis CIRAD86]
MPEEAHEMTKRSYSKLSIPMPEGAHQMSRRYGVERVRDQEVLELKKRFFWPKFTPFYEKRATIINGELMPLTRLCSRRVSRACGGLSADLREHNAVLAPQRAVDVDQEHPEVHAGDEPVDDLASAPEVAASLQSQPRSARAGPSSSRPGRSAQWWTGMTMARVKDTVKSNCSDEVKTMLKLQDDEMPPDE